MLSPLPSYQLTQFQSSPLLHEVGFMNYKSGDEVRLGDKVRLGDDIGIVVCVIDRDEYSHEHPREQWSYLKKGIMIEFPSLGLIHFPAFEPDLEFVGRSTE